MTKENTIINIGEIKNLFIENCEEENRKFTEKEFSKFINYCERDFYQWIRDNYKYFLNNNI
jgi:hypothetical protein